MTDQERPRCACLVPNSRYPLYSPEPMRKCNRLLPCGLHEVLSAAALLGRRGGQAGRGKAKARGDSAYYKRLRARQEAEPEAAPEVQCDACGIRTTSYRQSFEKDGTPLFTCEPRCPKK